jgi:uncharacterized protein YebE (UPF0316 family)
MGRACSTYEVERIAYRFMVGKSEGKRPAGSLGRRLEDNINMELRDVGWGVMNWIHLAQDGDQ